MPVLAAFGDAVTTYGPRIACDTAHSTAARLLKAGDLAGLASSCQVEPRPRWRPVVELPGLTKRRAKEMDLCLEAADSAKLLIAQRLDEVARELSAIAELMKDHLTATVWYEVKTVVRNR